MGTRGGGTGLSAGTTFASDADIVREADRMLNAATNLSRRTFAASVGERRVVAGALAQRVTNDFVRNANFRPRQWVTARTRLRSSERAFRRGDAVAGRRDAQRAAQSFRGFRQSLKTVEI